MGEALTLACHPQVSIWTHSGAKIAQGCRCRLANESYSRIAHPSPMQVEKGHAIRSFETTIWLYRWIVTNPKALISYANACADGSTRTLVVDVTVTVTTFPRTMCTERTAGGLKHSHEGRKEAQQKQYHRDLVWEGAC